ncbi:MAG: MBL fold metallo-hydrolase [Lachnospiraceae bacterium]|nr:MBL fold metallo-hydrolase [Lachnospiraceae bacterium]
MEITFIGAAHEVTGSCHYVSVGDKHFLVDAGMEQGADAYVQQEIPVNAANIDYVFITHAHIDHSGLLPLLYAHGFRGQVYATEATCELCDIMLKDSAHIQEAEVEWKNRKAKRSGGDVVEPLYTMDDAVGVLMHFRPCPYHLQLNICPEISIRFNDAGHLLGSSSIEIWLTEGEEKRKVLFSGDVGNTDIPLIKDPEFVNDADYVLIESTYAGKEHKAPADFAVALGEIIKSTLSGGGNLVIPAFSVGRTQELLYFIRKIKEEKLIPDFTDFDVYMDSPLAVEATNVFKENVAECFDEEAMNLVKAGVNPIGFKGLHVAVTSDESKRINVDLTPKVIISASGMCEAGRIRHHLKHNLWRKESTILFVGFQVPGTLGHSLLNGIDEVKIFGEKVAVNARIENLPGISGHADEPHLLDWLSHVDHPKQVFVVHGDDENTDYFADKIQEKLGYKAYAPYSGDAFDLITGDMVARGSREKVKKTKEKSKASSNVFARLLAAGQRLLKVIEKNEGVANKDLAKFADQINSLSDKWDR